jgi:transposase-like protein
MARLSGKRRVKKADKRRSFNRPGVAKGWRPAKVKKEVVRHKVSACRWAARDGLGRGATKVRTYVRGYTDQDLANAVALSFEEGWSVRKAAEQYGVPHNTVRDHRVARGGSTTMHTKKVPISVNSKPGRKPVSSDIETGIVAAVFEWHRRHMA